MVVVRVVAVVVGLVVLGRAADRFVVGSAELARQLGVSAVVVGALVVGLGTSAPELLVSGLAAWEGHADLGIGNVIGSNLANLTLVLGLGAVIAPVFVASTSLRREAPIALAAMCLFGWCVQGGMSRAEGAVLLTAFVAVMVGILVLVRRDTKGALAGETDEFLDEIDRGGTGRQVAGTLLGLVGTIAGAQLLVWGALGVADEVGVSDGFVGLTVVAVGTSLPEMVTVVQAARHGEHDLIVGNLLGSNIVNSLAVGAVVGLFAPDVAVDPSVVGLGVTVMLTGAVVALLLMRRRFRVTRGEGIALIVGYAVTVPLLA